MRRPLVVLGLAVAVIGLFTGGLAWVLDTPRPPAGAGRTERVYAALCASCHGMDGQGSWRAALFLLRPGNLADPRQSASQSDAYLFDIIKHGGSPLGRPGMPGFGSQLSDADIRALVGHLRALAGVPAGGATAGGSGPGR